MDVRRALRSARERAGLSQAALATRAGTSQATVSAYERGRKQPSVETLSRLLAAAGAGLTVEPRTWQLVEPTATQHARVARSLMDVLALAEALPTRHRAGLRFPQLASPAR
jgi:transcriptional regulator with XRE-family HTH domain